MSQNPEMPLPVNATPNLTTCTNCHSPMPSELRFCRNCGFRLGEGLAEYTETVRFGSDRGPMAPHSVSAPVVKKKKRRMSGMAWVFVGLLVFFIGAAAFTAIISPMRRHVPSVSISTSNKSYTGIDGWENVDGGSGVTFDCVSLPDGPADKAGLVGGDVITSFDGHRVQSEDEINKLMVSTPIGKTVDIEYIRDGETHKTQLTTISEDQFEQLEDKFENRPEGRAYFGYDTGDAERVPIPGTKLFGVKLHRLTPSRAADIAGVKAGDIVIKLNDAPIRTAEEFRMRARRALPYSTIKLTVLREGQQVEIPVKLGGR